MELNDMMPASEFCIHYNVELSFIDTLRDSGLIEATVIDQHVYLPLAELQQIEKLARLHYEMDINIEGIETITHLLHSMRSMQQQITALHNRLSFYDGE